MATILEALKGINAYPIPLRTLTYIAESRGVDLEEEATRVVIQADDFKLTQADLLIWLSEAPDVTQGGQQYSFTDEQRTSFRSRANQILQTLDSDNNVEQSDCGYVGDML